MKTNYFRTKRKIVLVSLIISLGLVFSVFVQTGDMETITGYVIGSPVFEDAESTAPNLEDIRAASCPTFWNKLYLLELNGMSITKTSSTSESIDLLESGVVDVFISGRALLPDDPELLKKIIGPGFSFISDQGMIVPLESFNKHQFYTDQNKDEVIGNFSGITDDNLKGVEDVYGYLDYGIVITSLENTDYSRSEVVHVVDRDGSRYRYSRTPTLYYTDEVGDEKIEYIAGILEE